MERTDCQKSCDEPCETVNDPRQIILLVPFDLTEMIVTPEDKLRFSTL